MAFLAASINKTALTLEKSFLELQKVSLTQRQRVIGEKQAEIEKDCRINGTEVEDNSDYQAYAEEDDLMQIELDSIDVQLKLIETMSNSMDELKKNGMNSIASFKLT